MKQLLRRFFERYKDVLQGIGVLFAVSTGLLALVKSYHTEQRTEAIRAYATAEPVLEHQTRLHVGSPGETGVAMLEFDVKIAVFNDSPVRSVTITDLGWVLLELPDGKLVHQYLRGPFRRSIVEDQLLAELPMTIAAGGAVYLYTHVLQPIDDELSSQLEATFSKNKRVDFVHINNEVLPYAKDWGALVWTSDGQQLRSSGFLNKLETVRGVRKVPGEAVPVDGEDGGSPKDAN